MLLSGWFDWCLRLFADELLLWMSELQVADHLLLLLLLLGLLLFVGPPSMSLSPILPARKRKIQKIEQIESPATHHLMA